MLNYASAGVGSFQHLVGELFRLQAGVDVVHVPYRGGGPSMTDVMAGQAQYTMSSLIQTIPHARSGTLKVIATPDLFISTGSSEPARAAVLVDPIIDTVRPVREAEIAPHPLTARQSDVLTLFAEGRSTKDIARRLGLAVPTVKTHLAAVYRQLGARNRLQAVVKAGALAYAAPAVTSMMRGMTQGEMFDRTFAAG